MPTVFDDDQAEHDRPEDVLDVGQRQVMRPAVAGDRLLGHLAGEADNGQEQRPGDELRPLRQTSRGGGRICQRLHAVTTGCRLRRRP